MCMYAQHIHAYLASEVYDMWEEPEDHSGENEDLILLN